MRCRVVPAPSRARIALAGVPWPAGGLVRAVHVGTSAVLLRPAGGGSGRSDGGSDGLLVVSGAGRGLVPGGICLPGTVDLLALRAVAEAASAVGAGCLDLSGWLPVLARATRTDLAVHPGRIDPAAVRRLVAECAADPSAVQQPAVLTGPAGRADLADGGPGPMDPGPLRRLAGPLAAAALAGAAEDVADLLLALVGAGPGSTPTGDDVVVGVLAALDRDGGHGAAGATATAATGGADRLRAALPPLLGRTTAGSRHDLAAAVAGQFAERVHVLVRALAAPRLVPAVVRAARGWGATSGTDLAHGIAGAATALADARSLAWRRSA